MYVPYDGPTSVVTNWLSNDPDNFYFAQKFVREWQDEGSDLETILSDLASYLTETLEAAMVSSTAGKAYKRLSDADMGGVDWQAVLDCLTEE